MNTFDDDTELDFFEEPKTLERSARPRRRVRTGGDGPRRPAPPPGAVGLARLAGLVALAILVVVGFVFWVGSCQGQSTDGEYASYLAKITPLAQSSARVGTDFANQLTTRSLTLTDLESKLKAWSQQEQLDYAAAQRLQPPGPLQADHAEVLSAFQLRALAFAGLADTLTQAKAASTAPSGATVAANLASQAQLLSASDVVWTELFRLPATQTLAQKGVTGVIVPASQIVSNADIVSARSLAILYARLGSTSGGNGSSGGGAKGLHGSALVSTQAVEGGKTTTLSTSTPETVSVGSSLVIHVTFVDSGNYPEVQIPVTLDVIVSGKSVYTKTVTVAQVVAKAQATASFSSLQVPTAAFGHSAKISVKIGQVPGEVRLDNNSATYPVFFSLAPSG
jgi:hypothetical protein